MFATFTDWEFSDMNAMQATGTAMWPDAATVQAAIDGLRAKTIAIFDTKAKATTASEVLLDFS